MNTLNINILEEELVFTVDISQRHLHAHCQSQRRKKLF